MNDRGALATFDYQPGRAAALLEFLKRTRSELRTLRMIRAWRDRLQILDVNGDRFEVCSLGYADPDVVIVLDAIGATYKRDSVHDPTDADYKEFKTGRRYAWAADRVM